MIRITSATERALHIYKSSIFKEGRVHKLNHSAAAPTNI